MAYPVILYKSLFRSSGVTITASSTDSGYSANDLGDLHPWKVWQSGTLVTGITIDIDLGGSGADNADTLGLVNQNITSQGGAVEVKADTVTPPTVVVQAAYTPAYGDVDVQTFTAPGNKRYWRLTLTKGGNFATKPYIGEVFLGLRTTLTEYVDPSTDPFLKQVEAAATQAQGGHVLGAILRGQIHRFNLAFGPAGANRTAYTSDLNAFIDNHLMKIRPFIFQLDSDDSDFKKPVLVRKSESGAVGRRAVGGVWSRLALSVPVEEAWSEAP